VISVARLNAVTALFLIVGFTILSSGCGSSSNPTKLRFVNAAPGQGSLNLLVNTTASASNIAYATASNYFSVGSGAQHVQIEPSATTSPIIDETITFTAGTQSSIFIMNSPTLATVVFPDNNAAPTSGNMNLRIINASPALGSADVYVSSTGCSNLTGSPSVSSLAVKTPSGYITLTPGTYNVCFTAPGTTFVFIDSGPQTWNAGQVRTLVGLNGEFGGFTSAVLADLN
jgi:Domain of unknown function (DUF4397)